MWSAEHTALQKCFIIMVATWKGDMNVLCVCSLNLLQVGRVAFTPLERKLKVEQRRVKDE